MKFCSWMLALLCLPLTLAGDLWAQTDQAGSNSDESVLAGHSYHGEAFNEGPRQYAYLMDGLGRAKFEITSDVPDAQEFFNQGIDQLHGFWYFEAERSFRQVVVLDPECAMAYWGLAMANINNEDRAAKFIVEAQEKAAAENASVTEREKAWIDSLAVYYDEKVKDKKKRAANFADEMEKLVLEYPDDIEAKAFLACQIWMNQRSGIKIASHAGVDALLEDVFDTDPMHPAHHYRIHLWDYKNPDQALHSASHGGPSLPDIAHMWHMPGHIYSRLKRYEDAVWQQEASARVDHRHMMHDRVIPDQIHNFAHNNEWCIRNLNHVGRVRDAIDLAQNMISMPRHPSYNKLTGRGSAYYGRHRLTLTLSRFELWEELIDLCNSAELEPTDNVTEQVHRLRYLGRALYRSGQRQKGDEVLAELESHLEKLEQERADKIATATGELDRKFDELRQHARQLNQWLTGDPESGFLANLQRQIRRKSRKEIARKVRSARAGFAARFNVVNRAIQEMQGHQAVADGDFREGYALLKKAGEADAIYRAWVRLQFDDRDKTLEEASKYVDNHENEVQPLAMLTWLYLEADEPESARETFKKLRAISGSIDMQSPVFTRLSDHAQTLGIDGDWRIPSEPAEDIGQRPDLDSLGPFRWQPMPAPEWQLVDSDEQTVSLKQFDGQPVIVIFYLGHGCLHCAEQLQKFAPMSDEFREAGIEMIAISTDDREGLRISIEDYGETEMPIGLLADPEHSVFHQYRAFDEFEKQPLHGTFLIDANGLVRWQDISYEPFMDAEFLLEESQRLLAIEPN